MTNEKSWYGQIGKIKLASSTAILSEHSELNKWVLNDKEWGKCGGGMSANVKWRKFVFFCFGGTNINKPNPMEKVFFSPTNPPPHISLLTNFLAAAKVVDAETQTKHRGNGGRLKLNKMCGNEWIKWNENNLLYKLGRKMVEKQCEN